MTRGSVIEKENKPEISLSWEAKIHNRFDIEVHDAKTGELKQKAQAFNVICDNLWSRLGGYFKYIAYSNGKGTPSSSDTTVFGTWYSAEAQHHSLQTDIATGVSHWTKYIQLAETVAVGVTITEVGIASAKSAGSLCTHAMLQDMNGNPISIKKTNTDIITIYATVYVHWTPSGQNGVYLMPPTGGGTYSFSNFLDYIFGNRGVSTVAGEYTHTYAFAYVAPGTKDPMDRGPNGGGTGTWDLASKTYTFKFDRLSVSAGNVSGGFRWVSFMSANQTGESMFCIVDVGGEYEVTGESVGTGDGETTEFSTKFNLPYNATIYVDGVAQASGVTVRPYPVAPNAFSYLVRIRPQLHDGKICPISCKSRRGDWPLYFYNPLHELGLYSWTRASDSSSYYNIMTLSFSDDFVNWSPYYQPKIVPEQYRHSKYIRMNKYYESSNIDLDSNQETAAFPPEIASKNIVFDTPPAVGSVITIDYMTPFVPKDENHVYDLSISIKLGAYGE